jgi:hypothetical protein
VSTNTHGFYALHSPFSFFTAGMDDSEEMEKKRIRHFLTLDLSRDDAVRLLKNGACSDGTYVLRKSQKEKGMSAMIGCGLELALILLFCLIPLLFTTCPFCLSLFLDLLVLFYELQICGHVHLFSFDWE